MNWYELKLSGVRLAALASGALWWPDEGLLAISDLHLGKSERVARLGGCLLPPYDSRETIARLASDIARLRPAEVVCLGDSFDDDQAARSLPDEARQALLGLQADRRWIWIAGNHDPAPGDLGGLHLDELTRGPLRFRHIAEADSTGEISGHFHPKAVLTLRGKRLSRPCFLADARRIIMPAYGAYTGGLRWTDPVLQRLMGPAARAILTGRQPTCVPMPRPMRA